MIPYVKPETDQKFSEWLLNSPSYYAKTYLYEA